MAIASERGVREGEVDGVRYQVAPDVEVSEADLQDSLKEVASALTTWSNGVKGGSSTQTLLSATSSSFVVEDNIYKQLQTCRLASQDDVVSGALDVLEGLALQGVKFEGESADEADVFNQVAKDVNLDELFRKIFRELMIYSHVTIASWWERKTYTVRGRQAPDLNVLQPGQMDPNQAPAQPQQPAQGQPAVPADPVDPSVVDPSGRQKLVGARRRKKYTLNVPQRVVILDPVSVIPLGDFAFGRVKLVLAVSEEAMKGWQSDDILKEICSGKYSPTDSDRKFLKGLPEGTGENLLLLRPDRVARHNLTKADYERFPAIRLSSIFPLLDLKEQLRKADRVTLVGTANHIILVKKGTEKQPGTSREVQNLKENVNVLAKLPVIVSDHRLSIEIITPDMSSTLDNAKYDTIDRRIMARLVGTLSVASSGQRNESTLTTGRMVARLLESRRHMVKRFLMEALFDQVTKKSQGGSNPSSKLVDGASLTFVPSQVELDTDGQFYSALQAARARNDLSRESYLEGLGYDQSVELQRVLNERLGGADLIFGTATPFDSPANNPNQELRVNNQNAPKQPGSRPDGGAGRPRGGGAPSSNSAK